MAIEDIHFKDAWDHITKTNDVRSRSIYAPEISKTPQSERRREHIYVIQQQPVMPIEDIHFRHSLGSDHQPIDGSQPTPAMPVQISAKIFHSAKALLHAE